MYRYTILHKDLVIAKQDNLYENQGKISWTLRFFSAIAFGLMTSHIPEELLVRRAGPQDYHAVLAISENVYDGLDYLPFMYHILLQDKKANYMYVGEQNGEIVSASCFTNKEQWRI